MNIRKLLAICIFIVTVIVVYVSNYSQSKNVVTLTPEELVKYESVYKEYPVVFLRQALNTYVDAVERKKANTDSCIQLSAVDPRTETIEDNISITTGLAAFDLSYYKSKFIVATYNKNSKNGNDIMIIFRDKPDRIFYAWVGRDPQGEICLLGFNSRNDTNQDDLKELIRTTRPSIYDTKYGI